MKHLTFNILITALSALAMCACADTVKTGDLSLSFDGDGKVIVASDAAVTPLLAEYCDLATLDVNGSTVPFKIEGAKKTAVQDNFGKGSRLTVSSVSTDGTGIARDLFITVYEEFPSTVLVKARYTNNSGNDVNISGWSLCNVKVAAVESDPYFWSFQGQSTTYREDWLKPIGNEFFQKNFMGMNDSDYGGGMPVVCIWRRDAGIIVGHLAPNPEIVSLPVRKVASEDYVSVGVVKEYDEAVALAPQASLETLDCFINVYVGDCFKPLRNYAKLLEKVGIVMPESEPAAFETAWCAWGYERRFTIDEIVGTLPKVKELGFKWATLDDGYQIAEGDWDLTKERFPHGDADMKFMVDKFHEYGLKAELWWAPLAADPGTEFLRKYPDSIILDKEGKPEDISWWDSYFLSPVDPDVIREQGDLVKKFIGEYGFDGLKLDGQHMNAVAPDYNPAHHPDDPEKDVRELPSFFKMIFNTARGIKEHAVLQYCPCGDCFSIYNLPYTNKTVSSDPGSSWQIRTKGYVLRAVAPKTAYYGDHIELSDNGNDFPTQLGIGAVIGTKFTWPKDNPYAEASYLLTPEKETLLKNALEIYESKELSRGEYVPGLYDIGFDYPEAHVLTKNGNMYYAFYTHEGVDTPVESVELRGLEAGVKYNVTDYYNHVELGEITASEHTVLNAAVPGYLLVEVKKIN